MRTAVLVLLVLFFTSLRNGDAIPKKTWVRVINILDADFSLTTRCHSDEDNFGETVLQFKQAVQWRFRPNIWGTTVFKCYLEWAHGKGEYNVYEWHIYEVCDDDCEWFVRPQGPCLQSKVQPGQENLLSPPSAGDKIEENEEKHEVQEAAPKTIQKNEATDLNQMKGWFRGKSLTNFLGSRREKKKEDVQLHTAKLDVALSLTQLAAAIANFTTYGDTEAQEIDDRGTAELNQAMGVAAASAAALVTTVWAEAAESLGAHRDQVASAINSGLAIRTSIDMLALTATTATCLRGDATLRSWVPAETRYPRSQEMLKVGAQICIIMPSGEKEHKWVTIYLKHKELILSFRKKYLGGALTTSKEYKAVNIIEETNEDQGYIFLSLKTNKGIIKLLFEDEKQSSVWISTISQLLKPTPR
ncbi:hypothetical protein RJ639_001074 [Escallonia herrerae]|uniref:PH domain-containing protein n=1 Tax=Escallonia herrerae TaxID=1293975 RepID=A0AA88X9Y5_9ASTE|nr:hypothetical protein RJ639_001074 [Escallonia herrerae]